MLFEVAGFGFSSDAHHVTGPDPEGLGVVQLWKRPWQNAGADLKTLILSMAHGTGTVFNDLMEAKAFRHLLGKHLQQVPVNSIKGAIGHTMAAAGAFEAILCSQVIKEKMNSPTIKFGNTRSRDTLDLVQKEPRAKEVLCCVSSSSGFAGINAALVFLG